MASKIVFLFVHRRFDLDLPQSVSTDSGFADAMQRAIDGAAGTMIGVDYRGNRVLAAYEPIPVFGWGFVAQINLAEVVAPYLRASWVSGAVIAVLVLLGVYVYTRITQPLLRRIGESERRLQEREAQYHSIFESVTDAILIIDMEGNIAAANPLAFEMYGYSEEEFIGLSSSKIIRPDYFHGFKNFKQRVKEANRFYVDSVNLRKDGTEFDIEMHGAGFTYRGEPHLLSVVRDITERKQAENALQQAREKIEQLHEIARRLEACESEDDVYRTTVEATEKILSFSMCSLDVVEEDRLVVKATSSELPPEASREGSLEEGGLAAKTYRTGKTTLFGSMAEVPEATPTREDFKSGISTPIGDIGVFQVVSTKADSFTENDVHMLELLLGHTTEAIKRIRLRERLKDQALHDPLTGIYNRRYSNQLIEQEIPRSKRYDHPIGFLMIDVNHFKEINDRHGHQVGDEVLQEVAKLLQQQVRESDIVVRYGGDEFLLVLVETNGEIEEVKQRILAEVARRNKTNPVFDFPVTFSIGTAYWNPDGSRSVDDVLAEADKRMYEEKGRHQQTGGDQEQ